MGRTVLQFIFETYNPKLGFIEKFSSKETFFNNLFVMGAWIIIIGVSIVILIKKAATMNYCNCLIMKLREVVRYLTLIW